MADKYLVVSVAATAAPVAALVDEATGYPKDSVDVGGGIHAPKHLTRTEAFYGVRKYLNAGADVYVTLVPDAVQSQLTGPQLAQLRNDLAGLIRALS